MENNNEIEYIGGWLVLVGIGIFLSPFRYGYFMWKTYSPLFEPNVWEILTDERSEYFTPYLLPLTLSEMVVNGFILLLGIYLIYLFSTQHYLFPKVFIFSYLFNLGFIFLDVSAFYLIMPKEELFDKEMLRDLIYLLIACAIWIPYMLVSKRVKKTFVRKKPDVI